MMRVIHVVLCPIKVNSNTIELGLHTSCYCVLDLFCVVKRCLLTRGDHIKNSAILFFYLLHSYVNMMRELGEYHPSFHFMT